MERRTMRRFINTHGIFMQDIDSIMHISYIVFRNQEREK